MRNTNAAYLLLADGTVFEGKAFGADADATGEVVFTTGMTGYLEALTDPNHFGQILVQTFPEIGNYGVIPEDFISDSTFLKGYVVREWCNHPSNFRSRGIIDEFLKSKGIPGIYGINTRHLTTHIRKNGTMPALLTHSDPRGRIDELLPKLREFKAENAVLSVTAPEIKTYGGGKVHIVIYDFGLTRNYLNFFVDRGLKVTVLPANTPADKALALNPDGIFLSDGPGDPDENASIISEIRKLMERNIPTFAIGLGHNILALAMGAKAQKLKFGHRGANHPVRDLATQRLYITNHNHGYAVVRSSLDGQKAKVSYESASDLTCEGIEYTDRPAFSVQFRPDFSPSSSGTGFLFDRFLALVKGER